MIRLTNIALALVFVVIGLGALTRLLDAGLGCPDWPGCYGFLTPPNQVEHIEIAESLYPHTPVVRHQAWMEMVHRYAAGSLGLIILALTVLAYRKKDDHLKPLKKLTSILSCVVILQAAFGMWTVTLKLWPPVVTLHLLGGFITFGLLLWLRLSLSSMAPVNKDDTEEVLSSPTPKALRSFGMIAFVVLLSQISLGAWTSSNYAGLACPDFPTCQNQWITHTSIEKAFTLPEYDNLSFLHGRTDAQTRVSIQVFHRLGALITTAVMLIFLGLLLKSQHPLRKPLASLIFGLLGTQICLGILSAVWLLPLPIALAHNLVAALLFGATLMTLHWVINTTNTAAQTDDSNQEVLDGHSIPNNA